jgi:selenocysteine lyase/cysteine desulfurase
VEELGVSLLAFPGHKGLQGPPGTGGLYVAPGLTPAPLLYGGTGTLSRSRRQPSDFPEGYEAGTANGPAIVGLGKGVEAVSRIGVDTIAFYERELISLLESYLYDMDFVTCYGPIPEKKTGICLFNIEGMSSEEVTERLSREHGIAVRGGYHCAPLAHAAIGTPEGGALRISFSPFNTASDLDALWRALRNR